MAASAVPASLGQPRVRLLGRPGLIRPDGSTEPLKPVDALLLARLALDGPLPRKSLAGWLWPGATEQKATTHLRQRVYRLRRQGGCSLVEGEAIISLSPVWQVDALAPEGDESDVDGLITAPLLGALVFEQEAAAVWLEAQRVRQRERTAQALADAAESAAQKGRLAKAIELAERLVTLRPELEHAHRRLMRLHFLRGDRAAAESAYERCRTWVFEHQETEPDMETRKLLSEVRRLHSDAAVHDQAPELQRRGALPVALLRPPILVGRAQALASIEDALTQCGSLVILGDAGSGKTRLVEHAVGARAGWVSVSARGADGVVPHALAARVLASVGGTFGLPEPTWVRAVLGSLVPGWAEVAEHDPGPLRLQQAAEVALAGWRGRGLNGVCIDDLHASDTASRTLLASLMEAPAEGRVAWLATSRPDTDGLKLLPRARVLHLPGLEAGALELLVSTLGLQGLDVSACASTLQRRTGGNPQHVLQLLVAAHGRGAGLDAAALATLDAPPALLHMVTDKLQRLSEPARALVRIAACAGEEANLPLAARVLGRHPADLADAWHELHAQGVMTEKGFSCGLLQEAAAGWTPSDLGRALHAQIAEALPDSPAYATRRARHWQAAHRWAEAVACHRAAAADAHVRGDTGAELEHLQQAAKDSLLANDQRASFAAKAEIARLWIAASRLNADTEVLCDELRTIAVDVLERATALELQAYLHAERVEPERALEAASAALDLLDAQPVPSAADAAAARVRLLAVQRAAQSLCRMGRPEEAITRMTPLQQAVDALDARDRLNWQLVLCMALEYADQRRSALALLTQVAGEAEQRSLTGVAADARGQQALALLYLGELTPSITAAERALELSRQTGAPPESLWVDTANLAANHRDLGRFDRYFELTQALEPADTLVERLRSSGNLLWAYNAENDLAVAYAWLGRPEMSMRLLDAPAPDIPPLMQATRWVARARLQSDFGVPPGRRTSAELLRAALALVDELGLGGRSYVRLGMRAIAARFAAPDEGVLTASEIEREAVQRENLPLAMLAKTVRLRQLLAADHHDEAAAVATDLLATLGDAGQPVSLYAPEVYLLVFRALQAAAPTDAARALQAALAWIGRAAAQHVSAAFGSSFLERNPVNVALRGLASWRPGG